MSLLMYEFTIFQVLLFCILSVFSFRDETGLSHFLRVEVVQHGALHYVTISDAKLLPAPIRIVNDTEVSFLFSCLCFY